MKLLQINTTVNSGSTGRIAEEIGEYVLSQEWESYIAYGRGNRPSKSQKVKIGNKLDQAIHLIGTRLFDRHGFYSKATTKNLVSEIERIKPDIIHLHNLHGYYLNIEVLFEYLKKKQYPVVWTLHDCWPFTGHCSYFDSVNCHKWKTECQKCPLKQKYPASYLYDNSKINFIQKKKLFSNFDSITIVTPSLWLKEKVSQSFLGRFNVHCINNGVNLNTFTPSTHKSNDGMQRKIKILGVASIWDRRKGLSDFIKLRQISELDVEITLVGIDGQLGKKLPDSIVKISRTENVQELALLYGNADIFINPTYVDNFPTTNLEALACGTPVITYNTGGSPEAIDEKTGVVVEKGDLNGLVSAIFKVKASDIKTLRLECRKRADRLFNKEDRIRDYFLLYQNLVGKS